MAVAIRKNNNRLIVAGDTYLYQRPLADLGAIPDYGSGYWSVPATPELAFELQLLCRGGGIELCPESRQLMHDFEAHISSLKSLPPEAEITGARSVPREVQRRSVGHVLAHRRCLEALDMGVGKTAVIAYLLATQSRLRRALIIAPKRVLPHWHLELQRHIAKSLWRGRGKLEVQVLGRQFRSSVEKKDVAKRFLASQTRDVRSIIVVNHESFWRDPFYEFLKSISWDLLAVDECHRAKSPGGKFSRRLARLSPTCEYVVGLTGTPFHHSFFDIYGQYRFINPGKFGNNADTFKRMYCLQSTISNKKTNKEIKTVVGFKNLKDFFERFYSIAYRVSIDEVLEIPPENDIVHIVPFLTTKERKVYYELKRYLVAQVKNGTIVAANALSKLTKLLRTCQGHNLLDETGELEIIGSSKLEYMLDFIDDLPPEEPLVIFCRFTVDINRIYSSLREKYKKRKIGRLSGEHNDYDAWTQREIDIIICQEQSASEGLDELKRARYALHYSQGFSRGMSRQKRARLRRQGQTRPVTHFYFLAEYTLEVAQYEAIRDGVEVVDAVLDNLK